MVISCAVPLSDAALKSQPTAWQALMACTGLETTEMKLVDCASAPKTQPHWVITVVGSCHLSPLGIPALWLDRGFNLSLMNSLGCDVNQDLHINIQSDL